MKGFQWAGDINGRANPLVRKFLVPDATAIERGEPIQYTQGTGVIVLPGPTDFDDPIFAVSMQEKAANDGVVMLECNYSPTAIYKYKAAKTYTTTGGSTTTCVDSSILPQVDNHFKGGAIKIISCAADATLNGRVVKIASSTGATGTFTLAETLPAALASGDTYQLCPGVYAEGYTGYDLDSDSMNPDYDNNGGESLQILWSNPETMETYFRFVLHEFANHPNAL